MTRRQPSFRFFVLVALALAVSGCGDVKRLQDQIDDLKEELTQARKMVDANWQATIRAVPGERYLQLIDDLNGGDKDKKAAAQRFLVSLGNLDADDLASKWAVSVWADWEGEGVVRIDAAPAAPSKARIYVEQLVGSGFKPAPTQGLEALRRPRTATEIQEALKTSAGELFDSLATTYSFSDRTKAPQAVYVKDSLLLGPGNLWVYQRLGMPPSQGGGRYRLQPNPSTAFEVPTGQRTDAHLNGTRNAARELFAEELSRVVVTPLETVPLDLVSLRFEEPWDVLSARQTLHVVISEDDWKRVGGVDVTVRLHKDGAVDEIHPSSREYRFPRSEFTRADHAPVADGNSDLGRYLWAGITLIDLPRLLNREGIQELKAFFEAAEEMRKLEERAAGRTTTE